MSTLVTPSPASTTPSLSTRPPELEDAVGVLERHAHNPSAFLTLNAETRRFRMPGIDGFIAYRPAGRRHFVQLGGVFADDAGREVLLRGFRAMAGVEGRNLVTVQLLRDDAELYAREGFTVNQFGASYGRSLCDFNLRGGAYMRLRNKISRARRAGIGVAEVGVDLEASPELEARLAAIDAQWLRSKGRHIKELAFMVGERGGPAAGLRRLFIATGEDGDTLGYITFSPVYGRQSGWLHDLSRRTPDAPPGTMELVIHTAINRFMAEGVGYLHFGLTPFSGLADSHELPERSPAAKRIVGLLAAHGKHIYPAADQVAYKEKWGPDLIQPEYVAFSAGVTAGAVWSLLRLTNAI
jgi:lysylphosphatidylglycerol synthetase-like protein (DUF2156 family)